MIGLEEGQHNSIIARIESLKIPSNLDTVHFQNFWEGAQVAVGPRAHAFGAGGSLGTGHWNCALRVEAGPVGQRISLCSVDIFDGRLGKAVLDCNASWIEAR